MTVVTVEMLSENAKAIETKLLRIGCAADFLGDESRGTVVGAATRSSSADAGAMLDMVCVWIRFVFGKCHQQST